MLMLLCMYASIFLLFKLSPAIALILSTESIDSVKFELFGGFVVTSPFVDAIESVRLLLNFKKLLKFRVFLPFRDDDDGEFDTFGLSNFCLTRSKSGLREDGIAAIMIDCD